MSGHQARPFRGLLSGRRVSPRRSSRYTPGLDRLEGRALLTALEVNSPGGIWGLASVDAQSDRNYVVMGTSPIQSDTNQPFVSVNVVNGLVRDTGVGGASLGIVTYRNQADEASGSSSISLFLNSVAQSHKAPLDEDPPGQVDSELGTSLGGNPGEWITLTIAPTGQEKDGDPVQVRLSGKSAAAGLGEPGVASHWELDYDAGDGQGEERLLSGDYRGGRGSPPSASREVKFDSKVGAEIRLRVHVWARGQISGGIAGDGLASLMLDLKVEPGSKPDVVAKASSWNSRRGGVDFGFEVKGGDLPADATVALYWAKGPNESDILSGPIAPQTARSAKSYGPFNVTGKQLGEPPRGATHLLVVADRAKAVAEANEDNNVKPLADVKLAKVAPVSDYSIKVIKSVMRAAGQAQAKISSTLRTPQSQALAMYNNEEAGKHITYQAPGRAVIKVYQTLRARGKTKAVILKAMTAKIVELGDRGQRVSLHVATPAQYARYNVLDIAPSSLSNGKLFEKFALADARIKRDKLLSPNHPKPTAKKPSPKYDPAYHLEIPQPRAGESCGPGPEKRTFMIFVNVMNALFSGP